MIPLYEAIGWNAVKKHYDLMLAAAVFLYLAIFTSISALLNPEATVETLLIRGFGTAALLLLHFILCIGPLARLDNRFLPLLYNRRHLGVCMFLLALVHGIFSLVQFHGAGDVSPLVSLFASTTRFTSVADFPFQILGFLALLILFVMAATSHDFWLANLTAENWKRIHMLVYLAYALLIAHVCLGALQSETNLVLAGVLGLGLLLVSVLHIASGLQERKLDLAKTTAQADGFVAVCALEAIPEKCAKVISIGGERIAIFRYDGKLAAVSNVCRHQNGPLGEGRIIDGCITCPWHGFQYLPDTGMAPPPFTEKVATYHTRIVGTEVLVHPVPRSGR